MMENSFWQNLSKILSKFGILIGSLIILLTYICLEILHKTTALNITLIILVALLLIPQIYNIYLKIKFNETDINILIFLAIIVEFYYQNDLLVVINIILMATYPLLVDFMNNYLNDLYLKNQINIESAHLIKGRNHHDIPAINIQKQNKLIVFKNELIPIDGQIIKGSGKFLFNNTTYQLEVGDQVLQSAKLLNNTVIIKANLNFLESYQQNKLKIFNNTLKSQSYFSRFIENNTITYTLTIIALSVFIYMITQNRLDFQRTILLSTPFYFLILAKLDFKPLLFNLSDNNLIFKSIHKFEKFIYTKTLILNKNGVITDDHQKIKTIKILKKDLDQSQIIALAHQAIDPETKLYQTIKSYMAENNIKPIKLKNIIFFKDIKLTQLNFNQKNYYFGSIKSMKNLNNLKIKAQQIQNINNSSLVIANDNEVIAYLEFYQNIQPNVKKALKKFKKSIKNIIILTSDHKKSTETIAQKLNIKNFLADFNYREKIDYLENIAKRPVTLIDSTIKDNPLKTRAEFYINLEQNSLANIKQSDLIIFNNDLNLVSDVYIKAKYFVLCQKIIYWLILLINLSLIYLAIVFNLSLLTSMIIQIIYLIIILSFLIVFTNRFYYKNLFKK